MRRRVLGLLVCAACVAAVEPAGKNAAAASSPPGATVSDPLVAERLKELDAKINQLEQRLGQVQGRGALRRGSSFLVDGGGQESVLERLRRVERELAEARARIAARDAALDETRLRAEGDRRRADDLAEKTDSLSNVRDHLAAAQQTLAERQTIIDQLNRRLAEAELARLRSERSYYLLAGALLKVVPGQAQDLSDLQDQVRLQMRPLQTVLPPGTGTTGSEMVGKGEP
jgi:TolA-binding protein